MTSRRECGEPRDFDFDRLFSTPGCDWSEEDLLDAFQFFESSRRLIATAVESLHDVHRAKEALHDFLTAYFFEKRAIVRYVPLHGRLPALIARAFSNYLISVHRHDERIDIFDPNEVDVSVDPCVEQVLADRDLVARIRLHIGELPRRFRSPIALFLDDVPREQIADTLGLSLQVVRVYISAGLRELRSKLESLRSSREA